MGDWVIANSNANPSTKTPQCVFAVNQDDPKDVHQSLPWGKTFPVESGATTSETPAAPGIDPETSMIFVDDYFLKGVYGIHLDQQTGEMKVKWSRDDWCSSDYFTMVGPKDERVLVSQNIDPDDDDLPISRPGSTTPRPCCGWTRTRARRSPSPSRARRPRSGA